MFPKYATATVIGAVVIVGSMIITNWTYIYLGLVDPSSFIEITPAFVVQAVVIAFMLAFVHEKIPHCGAVGYWRKGLGFGCMVFVLGLALTAPAPFLLTWDIAYWLDSVAALTLIPGLVIMYVLYQFEPGASVRKRRVCGSGA